LLYWCSNNKREIDFNAGITSDWNKTHPDNTIHLQPVPEGQSSEEVILAAVVGKTTPDIYANMWQGNVEMYAKAGALIALDTLHGFMEFIRERCDSAVIKEITSANGHIYQVPWKVNPIMTIYNKNYFFKKRHQRTSTNLYCLPHSRRPLQTIQHRKSAASRLVRLYRGKANLV
jgi:multiple sugar transport system substrate-binding protein